MADQGRWFKLWCAALHDPDLGNLSLEDFARWCILGCLVKVHGSDGSMRITPPAILLQHAFRVVTFSDILVCLSRFPHVQIRRDGGCDDDVTMPIVVTFDNWRKYQVDSSAERMRSKRARDARGVTVKKRGEEKRGEEIKKRKDLKDSPPVVPLTGTSDREWIRGLKTNPTYHGLDIDHEIGKCAAWCTVNGKAAPSKRRIVNWLNRAERPINGQVVVTMPRGMAAVAQRERERQERGE